MLQQGFSANTNRKKEHNPLYYYSTTNIYIDYAQIKLLQKKIINSKSKFAVKILKVQQWSQRTQRD